MVGRKRFWFSCPIQLAPEPGILQMNFTAEFTFLYQTQVVTWQEMIAAQVTARLCLPVSIFLSNSIFPFMG
jgi:hypothetical protein